MLLLLSLSLIQPYSNVWFHRLTKVTAVSRRAGEAPVWKLVKSKPTLWAIKVLLAQNLLYPTVSLELKLAELQNSTFPTKPVTKCSEFVPYYVKTRRKLQLSKIQLSALSLNNCLHRMISDGCSQPHHFFLPWQKGKIPAATVLRGAAEYPVKQVENHEHCLAWNQAGTNSW